MAGVAFKKTFSYAGFEMQPKKYESLKIALLNVELELKIDSVEVDLQCEMEKTVLNICFRTFYLLYLILSAVSYFLGVPECGGC